MKPNQPSPVERTNAEWVRSLKQGDQASLQDLWFFLFEAGSIAARVRHWPEDIGRDAAVESFEEITGKAVYDYLYTGPFLNYCRIIVVRAVIRRIRNNKENEIPLDDDPSNQKGIEHEEMGDPGASLTEVRKRLNACLEKLRDKKRQVMEALYIDGIDQESIAQRLNMKRNNVNKIAYDARLQLKSCLQAGGFQNYDEVLTI